MERIKQTRLILKACANYDDLVSIVKELHEAIKRGGDLQLGPKGRNATLEDRVIKVLKIIHIICSMLLH
jgi:hypothetical protein